MRFTWLLIVICTLAAGCACHTPSDTRTPIESHDRGGPAPGPFAGDPLYETTLQRYRAAEGPEARGTDFEGLAIIVAKALRRGVDADLVDITDLLGKPDNIQILGNVAALTYDYSREDGSDWTASAFSDGSGQMTMLTLKRRSAPE